MFCKLIVGFIPTFLDLSPECGHGTENNKREVKLLLYSLRASHCHVISMSTCFLVLSRTGGDTANSIALNRGSDSRLLVGSFWNASM